MLKRLIGFQSLADDNLISGTVQVWNQFTKDSHCVD